MKRILSLFCLLFFTHTQAADLSTQIFGGVNSVPTDQVAKSTVGIVGTVSGRSYICTGTLIDKDIVLTAAHCVKSGSFATPTFKIVYGTNMSQPVAQSVVAKAQAHQSYRPVNVDNNDIALLHFKTALPVGFVPVRLPPANYALQAGQKLAVAGYGINSPLSSGGGSGILRATIDVVQQPAYGRTEFSIAADPKTGDCYGDSGGPFYVQSNGQPVVVGVVSRGITNDCRDGGIHTRVAAHIAWIQQTAAALRKAR